MRDITTGALRRRHGADDDLDLDDSDDERQARRREKQREFAKMRRALLADDKVGELADNPKKAAFFKAIEDREEFDFDLDFLDEKQGDSQEDSSQDMRTEEQSTVPATETAKRKRPLEESAEDTTNRPPPHLRRTPATAASKKPASLAEIRETLSFLTETHDYDSFHEDASLDEEDAGTTEENNDAAGADFQTEEPEVQTTDHFPKPSHPRRTRGPVVDRLTLLRQASSNSASGQEAANTKLAFHSGGGKDGPIGFRPPQLLRRVTSSSSSGKSSSSSHRVTKPGTAGPKKGGAVNSYTAAREREREKALRLQQRNGGSSIAKLLNKHAGGGLGALAGKGQWD
jgi:mediator of replication checkpoint protein 1